MYEAIRSNNADPSKKSSFKRLKKMDVGSIDKRGEVNQQIKPYVSKNTIRRKTRDLHKDQLNEMPKSLMLAYKNIDKDTKLKRVIDEHKKISLANLMTQDTRRPSHKASKSMYFNQIQHSSFDIKKGNCMLESNSFDNIHSQNSSRRKQASNINLSNMTLQTISNDRQVNNANFQFQENEKYERYKPQFNLRALDNIIQAEYYYKNRKEGYLKDLYYQNLYEKYHNLNHPQKITKKQALFNQEFQETNPTMQLAFKKRTGFSSKNNINLNDSNKSIPSVKSSKNQSVQLPKMRSLQQQDQQEIQKEKEKTIINKSIISKTKEGQNSISTAMLDLQNQTNLKDHSKNLLLANQLKNVVKRGTANIEMINELSNLVNNKEDSDKKSIIADAQTMPESIFKDMGLTNLAPRKKLKLKLKPKRRPSANTLQEIVPISQFNSSSKNLASIRSNSKTNNEADELLPDKSSKRTESHNSFVIKKTKKFLCCF